MRRCLLLLLAFAACSDEREAKAPAPAVAEAPTQGETSGLRPAASVVEVEPGTDEGLRPRADVPAGDGRAPLASSGAPSAPAGTLTPPATRIALRGYEYLLNGRRSATARIEWKLVERDGQRLVEDVTEVKSREERDMAGFREAFDSESISRTLRTEDGELISQETVTTLPGRTDRAWVERTPSGYKVRILAGTSEEAYEVATEEPVVVDAEAFLGKRIQSGEAKPGTTYEIRLLGDKRVVTATLRVVGHDDEGPGLKVVETVEGHDTLWWFADDGSVVRLRTGIRTVRRDDGIRYGDLPRRLASFRITLPSNEDLPRIFTTKQMLVDLHVRTDETTKPPRILENPFTEVVERTDDHVTLLLKSHDDPDATCPLPIDPKGLEEHLKATALMEVDSPRARSLAKRIVGDAPDAREAARRIADWVFSNLRKGSSQLLQPTMLQILDDMVGDCSEHALLFTGLCRAAGIPVRPCSGYVNIGSDWGAHSWCEIWVGRWIGADPTTNEIGTRARYILLARPEEPGIASRITPERTTILIRRAEYDDGTIEIGGDEEPDLEVFSGIRLGTVPEGWEVIRGRQGAMIRAPEFTASISIEPDHGYRAMPLLLRRMRGGSAGTFGGRPAAVSRAVPAWIVPLGRELLQIGVQTRRGAAVPEEELAKLLAPTLARPQ